MVQGSVGRVLSWEMGQTVRDGLTMVAIRMIGRIQWKILAFRVVVQLSPSIQSTTGHRIQVAQVVTLAERQATQRSRQLEVHRLEQSQFSMGIPVAWLGKYSCDSNIAKKTVLKTVSTNLMVNIKINFQSTHVGKIMF